MQLIFFFETIHIRLLFKRQIWFQGFRWKFSLWPTNISHYSIAHLPLFCSLATRQKKKLYKKKFNFLHFVYAETETKNRHRAHIYQIIESKSVSLSITHFQHFCSSQRVPTTHIFANGPTNSQMIKCMQVQESLL